MFGIFNSTIQNSPQTKELFLENLNLIESLMSYSKDRTSQNFADVENCNNRLLNLLQEDNAHAGFGSTCLQKFYNLFPAKQTVEHIASYFKDLSFDLAEAGFGISFINMLFLNPFTPLIFAAAVMLTGSSYLASCAANSLANMIGNIEAHLNINQTSEPPIYEYRRFVQS